MMPGNFPEKSATDAGRDAQQSRSDDVEFAAQFLYRERMEAFRPFTHAPTAFGIGLKPVAEDRPLGFDQTFAPYLAEKRDLYRTHFDDCVQRENGHEAAERETVDLVHRLSGTSALSAERFGPLADAALCVPDDLLLLARDGSGWRLVSASLCFPSSWRLKDKFGHPLETIHAPVPHMAGKMGERIRRIFDMLRPVQPLWRENWAIEGDAQLRHARGASERSANYKSEKLAGRVFIRSEYQTLHKLPESGAILFTVRILVRALDELSGTQSGRLYMQRLAEHLPEISDEGLAYKGLSGQRDRLRSLLEQAAG